MVKNPNWHKAVQNWWEGSNARTIAGKSGCFRKLKIPLKELLLFWRLGELFFICCLFYCSCEGSEPFMPRRYLGCGVWFKTLSSTYFCLPYHSVFRSTSVSSLKLLLPREERVSHKCYCTQIFLLWDTLPGNINSLDKMVR